jgi:Tfp pilus assembly protein PilX
LVRSDKGFVLPLSVAVGAILMLLGVMMIMRASQGDKTAIAAKSNSRSQAVAEAGLTHFQSFLNRNRILATACSTNTAAPNCTSLPANPLTWNNFCPQTSPPNPSTPGAYANILNDWNNLNNAAENGQFRLVKYAFNPSSPGGSPTNPLGEGELILEGRVNQEGNEAFRISTTRLEVKFQAERTITGIDDFPAIWFNAAGSSSASSDVTFTSAPGFLIWDTSCPDQSNTTNTQQFKDRLNSNFSDYREIPGLPFPDLPLNGQTQPPLGTGVYNLPMPISSSLRLPRPADVLDNNQIAYIVPTAVLGNNQEIRFRKEDHPALEKVILYLESGASLTVRDGGRIRLDPGISLTIYSHGSSIILASENSDPAIDSTTTTRIYGYPTPTPSSIEVSGNPSAPLRLFIFAPQSNVTFDEANVRGGVWARSWKGEGTTQLIRDLANTPASLTDPIQVPRLRPLTSWRRCRIPVAPEPLDSCPVQ